MKKLKIYLCLIAAAAVAVAAIIGAGVAARGCSELPEPNLPEPNLPEPKLQSLDYNESTEALNNPDQGFYRPVYVKVTDTEVKPNANINSAARLLHLRMDISAYSSAAGGADKPLTDKALSDFENMLADMRKREKNAIVRFAYAPGFGDMKNAEPSDAVMQGHIIQICSVLNKYESVITAVEVGMIGPWGEMHSSDIANAGHISPLIDAYLGNTENIAVLVRTPKMIYDYLGISGGQIADYKTPTNDKSARLGLFNDGYLGSANDLGTYADRERDVAFLSERNVRLPFGGEVVAPDSKLHDIENCLPEMYALKLSYLNIEWNNNVIDKWKKTFYTESCGNDKHYYGSTAFSYIENRMGYRFVLRRSALGYASGRLYGKLETENAGFGNMFKKKQIQIIVADSLGNEVFSGSAGLYGGESDVKFEFECALPAGGYSVYMRICGDESDGAPLYAVRFANGGIWNEGLKANQIGVISA